MDQAMYLLHSSAHCYRAWCRYEGTSWCAKCDILFCGRHRPYPVCRYCSYGIQDPPLTVYEMNMARRLAGVHVDSLPYVVGGLAASLVPPSSRVSATSPTWLGPEPLHIDEHPGGPGVGHRPGTSGPEVSGGSSSSQVPPVLCREPVSLRPWTPTFVLEGTTVVLKPCPEYEEERLRQLSVQASASIDRSRAVRLAPAIGYPSSSIVCGATPVTPSTRRALPVPHPPRARQSKDLAPSAALQQCPPLALEGGATEVISDSETTSC